MNVRTQEYRRGIAFITLLVSLAQTSLSADQPPSNIIAIAAPKPGDKIAVLLPGKRDLTKIFCELVGDAGRVYRISVPVASSAKGNHAPRVEVSADASCTNVTTLTLQSRNFPAPELYNSSDDPGVVYAYVTQRSPIESFVAPEPLDMIFVSLNYSYLRGAKFGSPNMAWVNSAFLKALKHGGILIVEDYATKSDQVKAEVIAAGFEFVAQSKAIHGEDTLHASVLLKFCKPLEAVN